ncbi:MULTISPECIES: hypothetical protein [Caloramator]|uniref:Alpha-glucosidase n=1 Tax=Caloramator australicus RC3 TaxID=857293 RepID=I7LIK1_9CLOT|nr:MULTISPECIES: hypothetical protein [Caloramator]MDO6353931.1 hypothetical protein [Caloramator sp. CAR-1]WDU83136.1 hypothetical protein PWK10_17530 [Caloramator sp. Dgby_cultured_2]CCJ33032.1 alpha-glucosidase [Caloramator australicus RC3]
MDKNLLKLLDDIKIKLQRSNLKNSDKYLKDIDAIKESYKELQVKEEKRIIYESILNMGKDLLKEDKDFKNKLELFIRYCNAAVYDFNDNIRPLRRITLSFTITSMLFMLLAPQYLSYLLPLLMILPIFLGLKGMRKRSLNGLILGLSVMPISILNSVIIIRNAYLVRNNFNSFLLDLSKTYGRSLEFVKGLFIISTILGIIMLFTSIYTIYLGYKYKKMFV